MKPANALASYQSSMNSRGGRFPPPKPLPYVGVFDQADSEGRVDLLHLMAVVSSRRRFVISCGLAAFAVVLGFTSTASMEFRATGRLYLGELDARGASSSATLELSDTDHSDVASEVEILRSRAIVERAVLAAGLNTQIAPVGWEAPPYWRWRTSRRDLDLLRSAADEVVVSRARLDEGVVEPQHYQIVFRSSEVYMLSRQGLLLGQGTLGVPLQATGLSLTLLPGKVGVPQAGEQYNLSVSPLDEVVESATAALTVSEPRSETQGTVKVVSLAYTNGSPFRAASFLRHLMEVYLQERQAWKVEDATAAEAFVSRQLQSMRESLDATQERLADYRRDNPAVVAEGEAAELIELIGTYEERRAAVRLQVHALAELRRALRKPKAPLEAYLAGGADDEVLKGLVQRLSEARLELTELKSKFKRAAPDVKQQEREVRVQQAMIRRYVDNRLARASEMLDETGKIVAEYETKLKSVPGAEIGLAQIERESEVYSKLFSSLLERQQQAAVLKASTVSKNRILDSPRVPRVEDSPALGLRMMSGFIGMLFGAVVVVWRVLMSPALRSDKEIRTLVRHVPVFARVPAVAAVQRRVKAGLQPPLFDVLSGGSEKLAFAEAFRTLLTNLHYARQDGQHGKVLLFTSPSPGDGKTTCALSLAAMLAAHKERALVVDASVRASVHREVSQLPSRPGLRGVLAGECDWMEAVHKVRLSCGSFDWMGAGVNTRVEILRSDHLVRFLSSAKSCYDFVVLDAGSYPLVSDALALSQLCDFVLSVIRVGSTVRELTEEHLRGLSAVAKHHALVINCSEAIRTYGATMPEESDETLLDDPRVIELIRPE